MRLYLDDNSTEVLLVRLLRRNGHDVQIPADVGLSGADDSIHLTRGIFDDRIVLSHNHVDFSNLHDLVIVSGGAHPGIFMIRQDNDSRRDMTPAPSQAPSRNYSRPMFPSKINSSSSTSGADARKTRRGLVEAVETEWNPSAQSPPNSSFSAFVTASVGCRLPRRIDSAKRICTHFNNMHEGYTKGSS